MKFKVQSNKGFTLVEIVIGIALMGILAMIIVPQAIGYIDRAKVRVCDVNCSKVEEMYSTELQIEGKDHSDELFEEYLTQYKGVMCPGGGEVTYEEGKIMCNEHGGEEVPPL